MPLTWDTKTTLTTIINAASITAGNVSTSSEIANATDKKGKLNLVGSYSFSVAPTAGDSLYFYLDFDSDGSYENDVEEAILAGVVTLDNDTSTHYISIPGIDIPNSDFKVIVENDGDQTLSTITLKEERYFVTQ